LSDQVWPYGDSDDPVILAVNAAIPRTLPQQIREEACQELALAIVAGRCSPKSAARRADEFIRKARAGYQFSAKLELSLDLPAPGQTSDTPLRDLL
jgi:hypothetical protein